VTAEPPVPSEAQWALRRDGGQEIPNAPKALLNSPIVGVIKHTAGVRRPQGSNEPVFSAVPGAAEREQGFERRFGLADLVTYVLVSPVTKLYPDRSLCSAMYLRVETFASRRSISRENGASLPLLARNARALECG
jgi:hypothetical protein